MSSTLFALPERLADKSRPHLIADDDAHLTRVRERVAEQTSTARAELDAARRSTDVRVGAGVARDQEVRRLSSRIRTLARIGTEVCLGRIVRVDGTITYIGRIGLTAADGTSLLIDWRTAEAAPFFAATLADPMGLTSRRHYRWSRERIVDYWDEVFSAAARPDAAALDSQSAFIASLGASRSPRMSSVLGTIAADQDAAIRADSRGPLVVDGGPGTGKTVVALHRAAYLLYADPRLGGHRGEILIVGPHRPYLTYVGDVLPSLGEQGVATCTLADLVPGADTLVADSDPEVGEVKSSAAMVRAIDAAVAFYEEPPTETVDVETPWGEVAVTSGDWREAFGAMGRGTVHNEAHDEIWEVLADVIAPRIRALAGRDVRGDRVRLALEADHDLAAALHRGWPMLDAATTVADLWAVPAYLRLCAPWLTADQRALLHRPEAAPFTVEDLPLLDAARRRLGDSDTARRRQRRRAEIGEQRRVRDCVVDELIAGDDGEGLVAMLRAEDIQGVIVDESGMTDRDVDRLAGPFAHIIVDEAQDLTDAQWQMLLARCPSRSLTIVGDRAQSRDGFIETWEERLRRVGVGEPRRTTLTVNYRTPVEVMDVARPGILAALPDLAIPESIRTGGLPVHIGATVELAAIVQRWRSEAVDGTACVIGDPTFPGDDRVASLTSITAKGLEFDLVILVDPDQFGTDVAGAVDRYVAMTRTTSRLVLLSPGSDATN